MHVRLFSILIVLGICLFPSYLPLARASRAEAPPVAVPLAAVEVKVALGAVDPPNDAALPVELGGLAQAEELHARAWRDALGASPALAKGQKLKRLLA